MNADQLKRRAISSLRSLALFLLIIAIAACGASPAPAAAPSPAPAAASTTQPPVSLTYAFPDDSASIRAATELIKVYMAANPNVQIAAQPLPAQDYPQQLLARLDSGPPDLFAAADAQAPKLIKRNAALDLQPLLAGGATLKPDDFQPAALAVWQRGDALYGLPADVVPQVLFYNQDLFDASGVAYPAPGWTWDDWLAKAKQLTVQSGGQVTRYGTALTQWSAMVWGNGGDLVDPAGTRTLLDSAEAAAGVQFAADMVNVHKVAPPPKDAGGPDAMQLFQEQKVAMLPGASSLAGSLLAAKLPFKWAIAPLPSGKAAVAPLSVSGLLVSRGTQHQQAALDFATWVVGPQGQTVRANLAPFAAPALRSTGVRPASVSGADAILAALQHGRTLPQLEVWPEVKALVDKALVSVWQGKITARAAYKQIAPQVNAMLQAG